jgi:hypothetical protein
MTPRIIFLHVVRRRVFSMSSLMSMTSKVSPMGASRLDEGETVDARCEEPCESCNTYHESGNLR